MKMKKRKRKQKKTTMMIMMMIMIRWGQYCHQLCCFLGIGSNEEELTAHSQ
jgi:hypothetical protein